MSSARSIGFVVGILAGLVLLLILKKFSGRKCNYDERQLVARGLAFKAGFVTFVICELAVFFVELFLEKPLDFLPPGILSIVICMTALLVFLEVAIFKDAYFSQDRPFSLRWCAIMLFLAAVYIARFVFAHDGWESLFHLMAGIFIAVVMLSIFVKHIVSRRSEEEGE